MKTGGWLVLFGVAVWVLIIVASVWHKPVEASEPECATIRHDTIPFSTEQLKAALIDAGLHHPEVAYAQAILETGWFTSTAFRERNNLFGIYDSKNGCYYSYSHWYGSIVGEDGKPGYKTIQRRFNGGDRDEYLLWLESIGYAEDTTYTDKLRLLLR